MATASTTSTGASELFVVRHGERLDDVDPRWTITSSRPWDPPLTERGIRQAKQTGEHLKDRGIVAIYSSGFLRTLQTSHEISKALGGIPIRIEHGITEFISKGLFSGHPKLPLPSEVIGELHDAEYQSLESFPAWPEDYEHMRERVSRTVRHIADAHEGPVLVVSHGYGVQIITEELDPSVEVYNVSYCAISHLVRTRKGWKAHRAACSEHVAHLL